ncbi:hypothetical protein HZB02_02505 [Candidatus Woesearchaeota archaeon]|nr:hypothetical protein [Candidatus Woesearchaeota archaeon]
MILADLIATLYDAGIYDVLLPFLLIFSMLYATLQQVKILGEGKRNLNATVALVGAGLFVVPHVTGIQPLGIDPVQWLLEAIPNFLILSVAMIIFFMLIGFFGATPNSFLGKNYAVLIGIVLLGYLYFAFAQLFGFAILLSILIVIFSLLFGAQYTFPFAILDFLLIGIIFHQALGFSGALPEFLRFTEDQTLQFIALTVFAFAIVIKLIMGHGKGCHDEGHGGH